MRRKRLPDRDRDARYREGRLHQRKRRLRENNVKYLDPLLNFDDRKLFGLQMLQAWEPVLGFSEEENERAIEAGFKALEDYEPASASARARCSTSWSARTASASSCWAAPITTIPA